MKLNAGSHIHSHTIRYHCHHSTCTPVIAPQRRGNPLVLEILVNRRLWNRYHKLVADKNALVWRTNVRPYTSVPQRHCLSKAKDPPSSIHYDTCARKIQSWSTDTRDPTACIRPLTHILRESVASQPTRRVVAHCVTRSVARVS